MATLAGITEPKDLAFLPDGSVLFTERPHPNRIRRIAPNGIVTRFAGTGVGGTAGDGGLATAAQLTIVAGPALKSGTDDSVYILGADLAQPWYIVRRIAPDGIITTVAGRRERVCG